MCVCVCMNVLCLHSGGASHTKKNSLAFSRAPCHIRDGHLEKCHDIGVCGWECDVMPICVQRTRGMHAFAHSLVPARERLIQFVHVNQKCAPIVPGGVRWCGFVCIQFIFQSPDGATAARSGKKDDSNIISSQLRARQHVQAFMSFVLPHGHTCM